MKVGIALATFNPDLGFLKHQLNSIISQTHQDWVCAISDDSTDEFISRKIRGLIERDSRFSYRLNQETKGVIYNFQSALEDLPEECEYFCFCDQDDVWDLKKIETLLNVFKSNVGILLVHSDLEIIDEYGKVISGSCWKSERRRISDAISALEIVIRNQVTGCSLMFRKSLIEKALPIPSDLKGEYLHDQWFAALALVFGEIRSVPTTLVQYRQHSSNVIGASWPIESNVWSRVRNLAKLQGNSLRALSIRMKLASDLLLQVKKKSPEAALLLENQLSPLFMLSTPFFFRGLIRSRLRWPEFGLWSQLFLASLFVRKGRDLKIEDS